MPSLQAYNTFNIDEMASTIIPVNTVSEVLQYYKNCGNTPTIILGGGSNVLFTQHYEGTVLVNKTTGLQVMKETETDIVLKVATGYNWHELVTYCVNHNWYGLENLASIPGTVGAAPIQNIGAYGAELKQVCMGIDYIDLGSLNTIHITNKNCEFGYRNSIFKTTLKGKVFISAVYFSLRKIFVPNVSYSALQNYIANNNEPLTAMQVYNAVVAIRASKLPVIKELGNAGSFFKNPIVNNEQAEYLKMQYSDVALYANANNTYKVAAAWLIQQCGYKGYRQGNVGCYSKQPLVLVNYGGATGNEVLQLCNSIIVAVQRKFNITLQPEVNIV